MHLWRAVGDEGEVLDVFVQARRDKAAAVRLMRKLHKNQWLVPTSIVTDRYRAYDAALRDLSFSDIHTLLQWEYVHPLRLSVGPFPDTRELPAAGPMPSLVRLLECGASRCYQLGFCWAMPWRPLFTHILNLPLFAETRRRGCWRGRHILAGCRPPAPLVCCYVAVGWGILITIGLERLGSV
jgi:hypothetical protein